MDATERDIYYYLKHRRRESISAREIGRRIGSKRKFRYNPEWASPILLRMAERGILEADAEGRYRLKPLPQKTTDGKRWVSPAIAQILRASGKEFTNVMTGDEEDEFFLNL